MIKNYNHFEHNSMYLFNSTMIIDKLISKFYLQHGRTINKIIKIPA